MSDELAIARKAKAATDEAAELRAENAKLVDLLDVLRAQASGLAIKPHAIGEGKCHRCDAVYVDHKLRRVECQRCGSLLDPIDVLHEFAMKERNFLHTNAHAKEELARLHAEIEALKGDLAGARVKRVECPRGCRKWIASDPMRPYGVARHACYEARAALGLVPRTHAERWRVVNENGTSRWSDLVSATRAAAKGEGASVEEYTRPIGEKAERVLDRVEHKRQWREKMAASRKGGGS